MWRVSVWQETISPVMIQIVTGNRLTSASQLKAGVAPVAEMGVGGTGWIERSAEGPMESIGWTRYVCMTGDFWQLGFTPWMWSHNRGYCLSSWGVVLSSVCLVSKQKWLNFWCWWCYLIAIDFTIKVLWPRYCMFIPAFINQHWVLYSHSPALNIDIASSIPMFCY